MNNSNTNIFDLEMKEIERVWEPNEKKLSIVSKYVPSLLTTVLQEHDKNFPNKNSVSNTSLDPNYVDMQKKFKNEHSTVESLEYQFRRKFVEEKIRFIPLLFQLDDHEKAEIKNMKAQYLAAINSEFQKGYHRSSMPDLVKDSKLISCHLTFGFFGLKKTHTYKEAKKVLSANGMAVKK